MINFCRPVHVVAAIDFGTTFSGAAFSTKASFESNPLRVEIIQLDNRKAYQKTLTSVLFNKNEFEAFGEQAERKYMTLALQGHADDLFFFRNFKMQLHHEKVSRLFLINIHHSNMSIARGLSFFFLNGFEIVVIFQSLVYSLIIACAPRKCSKVLTKDIESLPW